VYIPDLELCQYHGGPFDSANWLVPLRTIGWIEHPEPFPTGAVPNELIPRLKAMIDKTRAVYPQYNFRGVKYCSICEFTGLPSPGPIWSQENIFIPSPSAVYVAPGGIVHYIEVHLYRPPDEFVEAALRCPDCGSSFYFDALRKANRNVDPPLLDGETFWRKFHEGIKRIRDSKNTQT
jgi:hypothetical protein